MNPRMLISCFLLLSLISAAIVTGGQLFHFINLPSVILVGGGIFCGVLWSYPLKQVVQAVSASIQGTSLDETRALQGHRIFSTMADLAIASGLLGTLIGLVQMLQNLDDPTTIGPAMAVALLTMFYGVTLGEFVFRPMANDCLSTHNPLSVRPTRRGYSSIHLAIGGLFMLLLTFFTMLAAMCDIS